MQHLKQLKYIIYVWSKWHRASYLSLWDYLSFTRKVTRIVKASDKQVLFNISEALDKSSRSATQLCFLNKWCHPQENLQQLLHHDQV